MNEKLAMFGTRKQTIVLLLISSLGESFPRELSRISGIPYATVVQTIDKFEEMSILAANTRGKERRVRVNPRFFAIREFELLIVRLVEGDSEVQQMLENVRMRPRKKGKAI